MRQFLLITFVLASGHYCFAQNGVLDSTFNGCGYNTTSFGAYGAAPVKVMIQPDGKILAYGFAYIGAVDQLYQSVNQVISLARYNPDGTTDLSYGVNGTVQWVTGAGRFVAGSVPYESSHYADMQSNGDLITAGTSFGADSGFGLVLYRFNSLGTIDSSFGISGMVSFGDNAHSLYPFGMAVQADDKIVVALNSNDTSYHSACSILLRYLPDGAIDSSFGINGEIVDSLGTATHLYSFLLLSSGNVLIGAGYHLVSYKNDGTIDSSFTPHFPSLSYLDITAMTEASDGSIYISADTGIDFDNAVLIKLTPNGSLDSTFNGCGYIFPYPLSYSGSITLYVGPDGKVLLSGWASDTFRLNGGLPYYLFISELLPNGQLNNSFGASGTFILDSTIESISGGNSLAMQTDGKIICLGEGSNTDFLLLRLLNELSLGIIDVGDSAHNAMVYPNPVSHAATVSYSLTKEEDISIDMYDVRGAKIKTLLPTTRQIGGSHSQEINLEGIITGDYIVRINSSASNSASVKIFVEY